MKKIISFLMVTFILVMSMVSVSAEVTSDFNVSLVANSTSVEIGDTFTIGLTYTGNYVIPCGEFVITYDPTKVSIGSFSGAVAGGTVTANTNWTSSSYKLVYGGTVAFPSTEMGAVTFTAIADGAATFAIESTNEICGDDIDWEYIYPASLNPVTVTIGGSTPDPEPVFTVDKAVENGAVKVTVANADKAPEGQIYVATFNGDVLVDCQVQDITNGTLTFSGLAGDLATVKMFVWDELMIPITYATSAQ